MQIFRVFIFFLANFMQHSYRHTTMKTIYSLFIVFATLHTAAQVPDKIMLPTIKNVQLHGTGNQLAYPIIGLGATSALELHFDDLNGGARNYSYTWQLCNSNWQPALLSSFDFIKGFSQMRITTYRNSSVAFVKYTHYTATLPDRNCAPSRSGNYLLKVFADGDTSKLLFTRRVLVADEKASIGAQVQQPFNGNIFRTHQKIQFTVNTAKLNLINPIQQVTVYILQNYRWDNAIANIRPTFIRQGSLEFNPEADAVFPGGREWRWLDLRSLRQQSDRVEKANYTNTGTDIYVKPDVDRVQQRLVYYRDYNGFFFNETAEAFNPYWQADYANVHFSFVPPGQQPFANKDVYVFGALSNYGADEASKMVFNPDRKMYEATLLLKQGYYNYCYVTKLPNEQKVFEFTEGNLWDTENNYTILVYYRTIGGRADELVGVTQINSLTGRNGGF